MLLLPKCITLHFATLNSIPHFSAHATYASNASCNSLLSSSVLALCPIFVSSANFLIIPSCFTTYMSRPFIKVRTGLVLKHFSAGLRAVPYSCPGGCLAVEDDSLPSIRQPVPDQVQDHTLHSMFSCSSTTFTALFTALLSQSLELDFGDRFKPNSRNTNAVPTRYDIETNK
jgi:hypothetical protein